MPLSEALRILLISFFVFLPYYLWQPKKIFQGDSSRVSLILLLILSIGIGFDYLFYHAIPSVIQAEYDGTIIIERYFVVAIATTFVISQAIAVIELLRDQQTYFIWLVPAMLYFFLIGFVSLIRYHSLAGFIADSVRSMVISTLMVLNYLKARNYDF